MIKKFFILHFFSILSICIAMYSCFSVQKQQETNTKPYLKLSVDRYFFPNGDGRPYFGLLIKNTGLGPAFITSISISTHRNTYHLSNSSTQSEYNIVKNIFDDNGFDFNKSCRAFPQAIISVNTGIVAGESIPLIIYPELDNQNVKDSYHRTLITSKSINQMDEEELIYKVLYDMRDICQQQVLSILENGISIKITYKSIYGKNVDNPHTEILKVKYDKTY